MSVSTVLEVRCDRCGCTEDLSFGLEGSGGGADAPIRLLDSDVAAPAESLEVQGYIEAVGWRVVRGSKRQNDQHVCSSCERQSDLFAA